MKVEFLNKVHHISTLPLLLFLGFDFDLFCFACRSRKQVAVLTVLEEHLHLAKTSYGGPF